MLDSLVYRIPFTSAVTFYASTMKPDSFIRYLVAALYGFEYISQLYTVMFCFVRVLVLFHPKRHLKISRYLYIFWSITSLLISLIGCSPHIMTNAMAMQLDYPFQYGSIILTTMVGYASHAQVIGGYTFAIFVTACIVLTTLAMLLKMKSLKLM
ncbi:hypothetical protein GCK72_003363 [Caenorhabditis remanei]|uniref:Serpentine receptor class gamma n=1 Tax=Caenorhabditis remanei TaxID=31234 RepID=A0A6A5HX38_CAERE|nr:hypothetical protein GCK72_003363 [Caenorhabditis remanei]KAF1771536.1 hypothetical protein GCK72_003363 [Caenorhabditis remanei]